MEERNSRTGGLKSDEAEKRGLLHSHMWQAR